MSAPIILTLQVEKAIPALALRPGDVVLIEESNPEPVSTFRLYEANKAILGSLEYALDRGHLTVTDGEAYAVYAALARLAGHGSPLPPVTRQRPFTAEDVLAALARLNDPTAHAPVEQQMRKRGDK